MYPRFQNTLLTLVILGGLAVCFTPEALAETLRVPSDFPTLKSALAQAGAGDSIEMAPGTYSEHTLVVPGGVTIFGSGSKPQEVLIDAQSAGRIFLIEGAADTVVIRNVTLMRGQAVGATGYDQGGGGVLISNSNVRIEDCVFSGNKAEGSGGGIRATSSQPVIVRCDFYANYASAGGGGAIDFSYNSSGLVTDCLFLGNMADWGGALSCRGGSSPRVENSELLSNSAGGWHGFGGGVFADSGSFPDLLGVTIAGNEAPFGGGVASWREGAVNLDYCTVVENRCGLLEGGMLVVDSNPLVTGSILAFNDGWGLTMAGQSQLQVTCTDLYGNLRGDWELALSGEGDKNGNKTVDPQFCSLTPGTDNLYHLQSSSPLAEMGTTCGVLGAKPVSCAGDKSLDVLPAVSAAITRVNAAPNPFNPQTVISFEIALAQDIRVSVYGIDGRMVHDLAEGSFPAGSHELVWNGRDRSGRQVGSGTYFVLIRGREETQRLKVTLLK